VVPNFKDCGEGQKDAKEASSTKAGILSFDQRAAAVTHSCGNSVAAH
jgi:hypothetical protein